MNSGLKLIVHYTICSKKIITSFVLYFRLVHYASHNVSLVMSLVTSRVMSLVISCVILLWWATRLTSVCRLERQTNRHRRSTESMYNLNEKKCKKRKKNFFFLTTNIPLSFPTAVRFIATKKKYRIHVLCFKYDNH